MQGERKGRISVASYFKGMGWGSVRGEGKAEFGQLETREKKKKQKKQPLPCCKMCRHSGNGRVLILKINVITVAVRTSHIWFPGYIYL